MFAITVIFVVKSERLTDFMPLMLENARQSLASEPGCQTFDVCQDPNQPEEVFLYEVYDDADAFEVHKTMPHFLEFSDVTEPMVVRKSVKTYTRVSM